MCFGGPLLFLPSGSHVIAILGHIVKRHSEYITCLTHPTCHYVLTIKLDVFVFLNTSSFVTKSVYLMSQIIYTVVGKHQFVHHLGVLGVESCRKDHEPGALTLSKFRHLLQDHTGCILLNPAAVSSIRSWYVSQHFHLP